MTSRNKKTISNAVSHYKSFVIIHFIKTTLNLPEFWLVKPYVTSFIQSRAMYKWKRHSALQKRNIFSRKTCLGKQCTGKLHSVRSAWLLSEFKTHIESEIFPFKSNPFWKHCPVSPAGFVWRFFRRKTY